MKAIPDLRYFSELGKVQSWHPIAGGVCISTQDAEVDFVFLENEVLRMEVRHPWSKEASFSAVDKADPTESPIRIKDTAVEIILESKFATVQVTKSSFQVSVRRLDGSVVFQSSDDGFYRHLNDGFILHRLASANDVILGLGEKTGALNRKGRDFTLWNTDVLNPNSAGEFTTGLAEGDPRTDPTSVEFDPYYGSIPFYQSLDEEGRAAGFFVDNLHRAHYSFENAQSTCIHFTGGRYIEYVFLGSDLPGIVEQYTQLTGRMTPPPIWAIGHHYCRWHPYSQAEILDLADTFRFKNIPCDSLWLDIDHMDEYRVFTWNKDRYPDHGEMLCELDREQFRVVTIVDPGVKVDPGWDIYESGLSEDVFCKTAGGAVYQGQVWPGRTAFPDFASPKARQWWGSLNAMHVRSGLAGIWNDMNEPATGDIPCDSMMFDGGKIPHRDLHNGYATLMALSTYEGLRRAIPDKRPFVLSRAGSAGIQKYAANWLGDNMSRWDHLAVSIPMSLGLGMSGQSFVGSDIGGFGENTTGELLARWYQAACLTPFCRNHNAAGNAAQYPWSFGEEVENVCRCSIELRYRLMPYLYSAFVESTLSGAPVMRPMAWDYQADPACRAVGDQFLVGPSIIVAPVVEKGALERTVILPEGGWLDWWTGTRYAGGTLVVSAPLDTLPLFVKSGHVIPMWQTSPLSTMDYRPECLELLIAIPEADGVFTSILYEDDGESFGFERGERLTTEFTVTRCGTTLGVRGKTTGIMFPGFRRKAFQIQFLGQPSLTGRKVNPVGREFEESFLLTGE